MELLKMEEDLTQADVEQRIKKIRDPEMTVHIADFLKILLAQDAERLSALESKGNVICALLIAVMGYEAHLMTRAISFPEPNMDWRVVLLILGVVLLSAGFLCGLAGLWGIYGSVAVRRAWRAPSDRVILPLNSLTNGGVDQLRRYFVVALHGMYRHNFNVAQLCAAKLREAQLRLIKAACAAGAGTLVLWIAKALVGWGVY